MLIIERLILDSSFGTMMMIAKNKFSWVLLLVCLVVGWFRPVQGFQSVQPRTMVVSPTTTTTALNVFGNKKTAASRAAEAEAAAKYWQGEWVCKDCGYIYNRVRRWLVSKSLSNHGRCVWKIPAASEFLVKETLMGRNRLNILSSCNTSIFLTLVSLSIVVLVTTIVVVVVVVVVVMCIRHVGFDRPNVPACTLKSRDPVSVVRNVPVLVVVTPKRWEIASERPWMEAMPPFSFFPLAV